MIAALVAGLLLAVPAPALTPTLTLGQALHEARADNPDLKAMRARLAQAHEMAKKLWASYLPHLSAAGSYTYNNVEATFSLPAGYYVRDVLSPQGPPASPEGTPFSPQHPPGMPSDYIIYPSGFESLTVQKKNQVGGQIELRQALLAPSLVPAIQAAYLGEEEVSLDLVHARRQVLFAVAQLYYGAVAAREATRVQEEQLATQRAHIEDAKVRLKAGTVPKIVLLRAQIDEAAAEQDLVRAKNAYLSAKSALAALLARDPDFEVKRPPDPPPPPPLGDLEKLATRRADVLAAEKGLEAAQEGSTAAKLGYLPTLGLDAAYRASNVSGFTASDTSWFVTLGLDWTLYDGGLREADLREAGDKEAEAQAEVESARVKAEDELRRARLDYESARANQRKATEEEKLARENQQLVMVGFRAGATTELQVDDANTELRRAELGRIAETLDAQLAVLELAHAAGTFDPK